MRYVLQKLLFWKKLFYSIIALDLWHNFKKKYREEVSHIYGSVVYFAKVKKSYFVEHLQGSRGRI